MIGRDSVKIHFQFPDAEGSPKKKAGFVSALVDGMRSSGDIKYAGYNDEAEFASDLSYFLGREDVSSYSGISEPQKDSIAATIRTTIEECHAKLPHPDLPIFVYVYPWFPSDEDRAVFGGATAFTAYYTMHVLIDLSSYSEESLRHTLAHEWNHLVFYRYHENMRRFMKEHIVMEGLAEVFREEVVGGKPAAWSVSFDESRVRPMIAQIGPKLMDTDMKTYRDIFFGGGGFERWTGYTIGYWLAKSFRKDNPTMSWTDILKADPDSFFPRT
jgi:uncharacterized protein YjaZ